MTVPYGGVGVSANVSCVSTEGVLENRPSGSSFSVGRNDIIYFRLGFSITVCRELPVPYPGGFLPVFP